MSLAVRMISREQHLTFVAERSGSFLQLPSWAGVKAEWAHESLGWFDGDQLVGAGLVLLRPIPKMKRYLAYLPEGPVLDWSAYDAADVTEPLLAHLRKRHAFTVKMGPQVVLRRWSADTLKDAIAGGGVRRLGEVTADATDPDAPGAGRPAARAGLAAGDHRRGRVRRLPAAVRLPGAAGRPLAGRRPRRVQPAVAAQREEGREGRGRGHGRPLRGPRRVPRRLRRDRAAGPVHAAPAGVLPADVARDDWPRTTTGSGCTWPAARVPCSPRRPGSGSARTSGTPTGRRPPRAASTGAATPSSGP